MKRGALVSIILVTFLLLNVSNVFGACSWAGGGCEGQCSQPYQACEEKSSGSCACIPEFSGFTAVIAVLCAFALSIIIKKKLK